MHQKYDITLKDIIKDVPQRFLKLLTGYEAYKFIDIQFPDVQVRYVDIAFETADGNIVQIELQSTNDNAMLKRMYLYSAFIYNQYDRLPIQFVLYVGNKPLNMETNMEFGLIKYAYKLIDMRNVDGNQLIDSDDPDDNVLAILCKIDDPDVTIKKILDKFYPLPPREREDYIRKLLYLSGLKNLTYKVKEEVLNMPITIDLDEYEVFKDVFTKGELKGRQEGRQEGRLEGELKGIEWMLEIKYGSEGLDLMDMVRSIDKVDKLDEFSELIKKSTSVVELRSYLQSNAISTSINARGQGI
ncbi:MAG: Rpn family recombination-promoting nuclease/putative transposase [Nitrospirae bacterium]|nr:Rpn family recombination-promoting nuclease/putative transposase [Nitrospirota bacterium]